MKKKTRKALKVLGLAGLLLFMSFSSVFGVSNTSSNNAPTQFLPQSVINAFGPAWVFVLVMVMVIAMITGYVHLPWPPSLLLYFISFSFFAAMNFFSYAIIVLLGTVLFGLAAFGVSRVFADLTFAN